jgi:hypothetical protein
MLAYNHEEWIGQAIESVLAQDFESVIDDEARGKLKPLMAMGE